MYKPLAFCWIAVDKNSKEFIYNYKPERSDEYGEWFVPKSYLGSDENFQCIPLVKGSINLIVGRNMTWEDEPVFLLEER